MKKINWELARFVREFGNKMYTQLVKHEDKGSWAGCTAVYLRRRMYENIAILSVAIERQAPVEYVERKAANVANYASMIADNYRKEHPEK